MITYLTDQTTAVTGTELGFCPTTPANLRCLSSGECRVCKLIDPNYEGCDVTSTTPVCDSDISSTDMISTNDDPTKTPQCVGCKKTSKYLGGVGNYIHKHVRLYTLLLLKVSGQS